MELAQTIGLIEYLSGGNQQPLLEIVGDALPLYLSIATK